MTTKARKTENAKRRLRWPAAWWRAGRGRVRLYRGKCETVLPGLPTWSVDAIVSDPPYGIKFMGKDWDSPGGAGNFPMRRYQEWCEAWAAEAFRVAKPGAHLLAFGGTRTFHRLACGLEDAGWEIRDCIMWVYGSGFPKSLDVSKAIDKAAGAKRRVVGSKSGSPGYSLTDGKGGLYGDGFGANGTGEGECRITVPATDAAREWAGFGTALKPAWEPILVCRKPLSGTVAQNVLAHGTGALNIDGGRVPLLDAPNYPIPGKGRIGVVTYGGGWTGSKHASNRPTNGSARHDAAGRWPANLVHDGSEEVLSLFPQTSSGREPAGGLRRCADKHQTVYASFKGQQVVHGTLHGDSGSAARFFYCAKASRREREAWLRGHLQCVVCGGRYTETHRDKGRTVTCCRNVHPTVKPLALMRYLVRLVTPPGGMVLDPFLGSGTTALAALAEDLRVVGVDAHAPYLRTARRRIEAVLF